MVKAQAGTPFKGEFINEVQDAVDTSFDLVGLEDNIHRVGELLNLTHPLIERLLHSVDGDATKIVLYYKFKFEEFRGNYFQIKKESDEAINSFQLALSTWKIMTHKHKFYGSGNSILNSHREGARILVHLAAQQCYRCRDKVDMTEGLDNALKAMRLALKEVNIPSADFEDDLQEIFFSDSSTAYSSGGKQAKYRKFLKLVPINLLQLLFEQTLAAYSCSIHCQQAALEQGLLGHDSHGKEAGTTVVKRSSPNIDWIKTLCYHITREANTHTTAQHDMNSASGPLCVESNWSSFKVNWLRLSATHLPLHQKFMDVMDGYFHDITEENPILTSGYVDNVILPTESALDSHTLTVTSSCLHSEEIRDFKPVVKKTSTRRLKKKNSS